MTTEILRITRQRGGDHHPISSRQFIIEYLSFNGEDYGANIHRAYKDALRDLGNSFKPKRNYHKPRYSSFNKIMNMLAREGIIEFTGREEESDDPMFANMEWKPVRRYYRLVEGGAPPTKEILTRKLASDLTDGHGIDTERLGELPELRASIDGRQPAKNQTNLRKRQ